MIDEEFSLSCARSGLACLCYPNVSFACLIMESVTASSIRYTSDYLISFICEFANGIKTFWLFWVLRDLDPGTPCSCFVDGKTKNGSDFGEKLKNFPYEDASKKWESDFNFNR